MTPPFPQRLAELGPWQVFADELIERGDRLGPYLAYELSLGASPTKEQLVAFQKKAVRVCRVPKPFAATWMLGHVRTLAITSDSSKPMSGALPGLRDLFATPALVNLEQFSFAARGESIGRRWQEAMRRLPKSCRRFELHASRFTADDAAKVIDGIPPQVEVLRVFPRYGTDPSMLISDRFAWVDLRPIVVTPELAESLAAALAATSRVKLRLGTVSHRSVVASLGERAVVGDVDDAALVEEDPRGAISLFERTRLDALQVRYGVVTARAQIERSLKESFRLGRSFSGVSDTAGWSGDAVITRAEGTWWARAVGVTGETPSITLDGTALTTKPAPLAEGARLHLNGRPWRFAAHPLSPTLSPARGEGEK